MQIKIGNKLFSIDETTSKLDFRIPFIRIGKFEDINNGDVDFKIHIDITTHIGYSSYDYGNSFTFIVLGFGIDYWWTDKLCIDLEEDIDEDV